MPPEIIGGRYRVLRAIGQGGMGTVWLCHDETLARDVAVKQVGLFPGESATDSARALREARSSAALGHRNVVTVFDVVEETDRVWLVMEHVPSHSLSELIKQEGRLCPDRVASIGAQVADGLSRAHAVGTTHRDVKPGNIFVREDGVAKIGDFGIARTVGDPALTQTGLLTGTPTYFSPEVATGADPGPASDVWALGATLYAAVEGRPPYQQRTNAMSVLAEIARTQPPPPRHAGPLEPTLMRMMDRDPATRWSMDDAAHSLRRLADRRNPGTAVQPKKPVSRPAPPTDTAPPIDTGRSQAPRRRTGAYVAVLAAALLLVIGGIALAGTLGDDPGSTEASGGTDGTPSATPSKRPSKEPSDETTPTQATDPTTDTAAQSGGPAAQVAFVDGYFDAAPQDADAGWASLSPSYQAETGRGSYDTYWGSMRSADATDVSAQGGGTVELTVEYVFDDGRAVTERQRIYLERSGSGFLIDGYDTIG